MGNISLIVAVANQNVMGKDNQLPWNLPDDLKYFKNQTWGMPVIMGRKTFTSLGKALPGRKNIVISRNASWQAENITKVSSVNQAIEKGIEMGAKEVFVLGGAQIFKEVMPVANKIYLTRIYASFEGDVFFPEMIQDQWILASERPVAASEKSPLNHSFQIWERVI